jgi:hypothetical protein
MKAIKLAKKIAEEFSHIDDVEAIALGGSQSSLVIDQLSDIDLYIYSKDIVPLSKRQEIVAKFGARKADMNLQFWDTGDEWFDLETGIEVDVMFWSPDWIEEQLDRVIVQYQPSMGYTTCFWYTIKNSNILFNRSGWFEDLQEKSKVPYPKQLRRAIIAKNYPVLRDVIPSYYNQIKKAVERGDLVSINHRIAAFFASYFDVLFALNEVLHPGEKKLIPLVLSECSTLPSNLQEDVESVFVLGARGDRKLLEKLDPLVDGLDNLLQQEGFEIDK